MWGAVSISLVEAVPLYIKYELDQRNASLVPWGGHLPEVGYSDVGCSLNFSC